MNKWTNHPPATSAVCSSPQATSATRSFRTQNLLGALSANLDFPNVKTPPDSARHKLCDI